MVNFPINLQQLYPEKQALVVEKVKDIEKLLKCVPLVHYQFFKKLRAEQFTPEDNGIAKDVDYSDDEEHGE